MQGGLVLVDTAAMAQMLRLSHVCHLAIEPLTQVAVGSKRQQGVPAGGPSVGQEERLPWEGRLVVKLGGLSAVVAKSEDAPGENTDSPSNQFWNGSLVLSQFFPQVCFPNGSLSCAVLQSLLRAFCWKRIPVWSCV